MTGDGEMEAIVWGHGGPVLSPELLKKIDHILKIYRDGALEIQFEEEHVRSLTWINPDTGQRTEYLDRALSDGAKE